LDLPARQGEYGSHTRVAAMKSKIRFADSEAKGAKVTEDA